MAELTKLLGFMSSWDRQAVLSEYAAKFENCSDFDALLAELGTPTKVAISLAGDYVPSPPPEASAPVAETASPDAPETETPPEESAPAADSEPLPEEAEANAEEPAAVIVTDPEEPVTPEPLPATDEAAAPAAPAAQKPRHSVFGIIVSVILGVLIALPFALAFACLGIPFFFGGIGTIAAAVTVMLRLIPPLGLFSDILLVLGSGLIVSAIGLLLAAFGFWLSFSLERLWLAKLVFPAGRRLCRKKEVPQE